MNYTTWLLVGCGGALGASARYACSVWVGSHHLFPWATLAINIAGSLAIGLAWGAYAHTEWFQHWGRLFLVAGLLGGFTTFSAFSLETLTLLQASRMWAASGYVLVSVVGCLLAVALGVKLGRLG